MYLSFGIGQSLLECETLDTRVLPEGACQGLVRHG